MNLNVNCAHQHLIKENASRNLSTKISYTFAEKYFKFSVTFIKTTKDDVAAGKGTNEASCAAFV